MSATETIKNILKDKNISQVELAEKTSDAQLAREFELALPTEFSREQQIEVVESFVRENLPSEMGAIIRTTAEKASKEDILEDINYQIEKCWYFWSVC